MEGNATCLYHVQVAMCGRKEPREGKDSFSLYIKMNEILEILVVTRKFHSQGPRLSPGQEIKSHKLPGWPKTINK